MNSRARAVEILLVEDSPSDARLTQEALRESEIVSRLHVVQDGEEALRFLRQQAPHTDAPRPELIFLDLNLPGKSGREVLAEIKSDLHLRAIPVCILTTSNNEQDVSDAYALNANCYISKPLNVEDFVAQIKAISNFWFSGPRSTE